MISFRLLDYFRKPDLKKETVCCFNSGCNLGDYVCRKDSRSIQNCFDYRIRLEIVCLKATHQVLISKGVKDPGGNIAGEQWLADYAPEFRKFFDREGVRDPLIIFKKCTPPDSDMSKFSEGLLELIQDYLRRD